MTFTADAFKLLRMLLRVRGHRTPSSKEQPKRHVPENSIKRENLDDKTKELLHGFGNRFNALGVIMAFDS